VSINAQQARDGTMFILTMAADGNFSPVQRLKFSGNTAYTTLVSQTYIAILHRVPTNCFYVNIILKLLVLHLKFKKSAMIFRTELDPPALLCEKKNRLA